jgi:uncharacterized protein YidB (DUF937 family)
MDILEMGASLLSEKMGVDLDSGAIGEALKGLLSNEGGDLDLAGLAASMTANGGLANIVSSWLGDGANEAISADTVAAIFDSDKLSSFAESLGVDSGSAAGGLAEVLPEIMDKASSGGSLLDLAGGAEGLLGAAKSLFS